MPPAAAGKATSKSIPKPCGMGTLSPSRMIEPNQNTLRSAPPPQIAAHMSR